MKRFVLFALLLTGCATAKETPLFNGHDLAGWNLVSTAPAEIAKSCSVRPDGVIAVTGQPVCYLATIVSYKNYTLHAEWRWPGKAGNGGVLLHISSGPKDRAWPVCYQVQTKNKSVGDLLPMAGATFAEPITSATGAPLAHLHTAADSEKPAGEWNSCDIVCRDGAVEVTINGVRQNKITGCSVSSGPVGFQLEGTPFELRNVRLTPAD